MITTIKDLMNKTTADRYLKVTRYKSFKMSETVSLNEVPETDKNLEFHMWGDEEMNDISSRFYSYTQFRDKMFFTQWQTAGEGENSCEYKYLIK
jgi:hypothetical protein